MRCPECGARGPRERIGYRTAHYDALDAQAWTRATRTHAVVVCGGAACFTVIGDASRHIHDVVGAVCAILGMLAIVYAPVSAIGGPFFMMRELRARPERVRRSEREIGRLRWKAMALSSTTSALGHGMIPPLMPSARSPPSVTRSPAGGRWRWGLPHGPCACVPRPW